MLVSFALLPDIHVAYWCDIFCKYFMIGSVLTLKAALTALHSVHSRWHDFGLLLDIPPYQLEIITAVYYSPSTTTGRNIGILGDQWYQHSSHLEKSYCHIGGCLSGKKSLPKKGGSSKEASAGTQREAQLYNER